MIDKNKVVFFDIDTQIDFISPKGALYVPQAETVVGNLKKLVEFARKNGITIVATEDSHVPDDPEFKEFPPHCVRGTWGNQKIEATRQKDPFVIDLDYKGDIPADRKEYLIKKQVYYQPHPFFGNSPADELLKKIKKPQAVVFGIATDFCVRSAVDGLFDRGWKVFLVTDAIKEISKDAAKKLLDDWSKRGVRLVTTAEITETAENR